MGRRDHGDALHGDELAVGLRVDNRLADALRTAELGRDLALRANAPIDYAVLSEIHRKAGRNALARADIEEATLASH